MKKTSSIEPKNLTAQLHYRGEGNPPSSHPSTAVSNCYPGLEMDFRNVWKHVFEGIVLLEYSNLVTGVDPGANEKIQRLVSSGIQYELISADGIPMTAPVTGPSRHSPEKIHDTMALEWSNALAEVLPKAGQFVLCKFQNSNNLREILSIELKVRHFFDVDLNQNGKVVNQRVVIAREMAGPGDLTQSLCSPWQNDYRECDCFYWAASRPDFVNVEPGKDGKSKGNNWMQKDRTDSGDKKYISDDEDGVRGNPVLVSYQDLFAAWEENLRFIIAGKDETLKKSRKSVKAGGKKKSV
jgi:hypothetical protein